MNMTLRGTATAHQDPTPRPPAGSPGPFYLLHSLVPPIYDPREFPGSAWSRREVSMTSPSLDRSVRDEAVMSARTPYRRIPLGRQSGLPDVPDSLRGGDMRQIGI